MKLCFGGKTSHDAAFPGGRAGDILKQQGWDYKIDETIPPVTTLRGGELTAYRTIIITPEGDEVSVVSNAYLAAAREAYRQEKEEKNNSLKP